MSSTEIDSLENQQGTIKHVLEQMDDVQRKQLRNRTPESSSKPIATQMVNPEPCKKRQPHRLMVGMVP